MNTRPTTRTVDYGSLNDADREAFVSLVVENDVKVRLGLGGERATEHESPPSQGMRAWGGEITRRVCYAWLGRGALGCLAPSLTLGPAVAAGRPGRPAAPAGAACRARRCRRAAS